MTDQENAKRPTEPVQQTIFDALDEAPPLVSPLEQEVLVPEDTDPKWTKDVTNLVDVPVANAENIRTIPVEITDAQGNKITNHYPGKVLLRRCPHPDFVRIGDKVVPRASVHEHDLSSAKPIMVDAVTNVLYKSGVVMPFHMDVFHAIMHLAMERYDATGINSGNIETTRSEILQILGAGKNGRTYQAIDEAFSTLQGLQVTKSYNGVEGDDQNLRTIHVMGGPISEFRIHEGASHRTRGGGADVIEITLNHEIYRSMTIGARSREWSLRTLNLSKTLSIQEHWQRQLYRILDSRFQQTGYLRIPAQELWVGCLGNPATDLEDWRWRKAKSRLRKALQEFERTGYLQEFKIYSGKSLRRKDAKQNPAAEGQQQEDQQQHYTLDMLDHGTATFKVESPYRIHGDDLEWIQCAPGPGYYSDGPRREKDYALDMLECLFAGETTKMQIEAMATSVGADVVLELTSERIKAMVVECRDLYRRLPQRAWMAPSDLPTAEFDFHFGRLFGDYERRTAGHLVGDFSKGLTAPTADRRTALTTSAVVSLLERYGFTLTDALEGKALGSEKPAIKDVSESMDKALATICRRNNLTLGCLDALNRRKPHFAAEWAKVSVIGADVALKTVAVLMWQDNLRSKMDAAIAAAGSREKWIQKIWKEMARSINAMAPRTVAQIAELSIGRAAPQDAHKPGASHIGQINLAMAHLLRARLAETVYEDHLLGELEDKLKAGSTKS